MVFTVISKEEVKFKFDKAEDKSKMIGILADLTVSTRKEVAEFLGVKLIKTKPYVV